MESQAEHERKQAVTVCLREKGRNPSHSELDLMAKGWAAGWTDRDVRSERK